jgi:hypothetical protein
VTMRQNISALFLTALILPVFPAAAIMERGDYPWGVELRSFYDDDLGFRMWFLNLGPTGIRARIHPANPDQFVVEHVFQDAKSPAKGKLSKGDVIVGPMESYSRPPTASAGIYPAAGAGMVP